MRLFSARTYVVVIVLLMHGVVCAANEELKDRGTGPCLTVARDYEGGRSLRHGPVPCLMTEQRDKVQFCVSLENVVYP